MLSEFLKSFFANLLSSLPRGSCSIRVQSVLYKVRLEQIKSANSQIVLKGMYNKVQVKTESCSFYQIWHCVKNKLYHFSFPQTWHLSTPLVSTSRSRDWGPSTGCGTCWWLVASRRASRCCSHSSSRSSWSWVIRRSRSLTAFIFQFLRENSQESIRNLFLFIQNLLYITYSNQY